MKITIVRHAKVNMKWPSFCNSEEFNEACRNYDLADIEPTEKVVERKKENTVYVSSLLRTHRTAEEIFEISDNEYIQSSLLDEVSLCAGFHSKRKLPIWIFNVVGRIQWLFNDTNQKEGRIQTIKRANQLVDMLLAHNEDCIIITHGFFMHTLMNCLRKKGFTVERTHIGYKNLEMVEAISER